MLDKNQTTELSNFISKMNIDKLEIPTSKQEEWRFTNLNFLHNIHFEHSQKGKITLEKSDDKLKSNNKHQICLINNENNNNFMNTIDGLDILDMNSAINKYPKIIKTHFSKIYPYKNDYFCTKNMLDIDDGIFIYVKKDSIIKLPLEIIFSTINTQVSPRIFIYCSSNSNFSIIEKYVSKDDTESFTNAITEIYLEKNSNLEYVKIQTESSNSTHFSGLGIHQENDSIINCHTFTKETGFTRNNIFSKLNGSNSECRLNGLSIGSKSNFIDNHSIIQHSAPHSISSELYKGIYSDASKGVFDGKIIVDDNATKIDSEQLNNNILLSEDASVNSNPRLEINTDDVTCKHGSTTGQLENEALFYLKSRGFNNDRAQKILLQGFCSEFIDNINNQEICDDFESIITSYINNI